MNLKDFYIVASKVLELLNEYDTTPRYQTLIQHLNTIRSNPTPDLQEAINQIIDEIVEQNHFIQDSLGTIPHSSFVIDKLDIDDCIGIGATNRLKEIIQKQAYIAPTSVTELINDIAATKRQLKSIIDELNNFGIEYDTDNEQSILSIEYSGTVQVETTEDLKQQLNEIEKIVHAYARLSNDTKAFSKPTIISLSKSSPLVIDVGDGAAIALALTTICKTITWIMNRIEQVYDIRIKREQLRSIKLSNKKIEEGFDDLITKLFSDGEISKHINHLYKESSPSDIHGSEAETKKALTEAVKSLIDLIDKQGANVKIFVETPKENDDPEVNIDIVNINNSYLRLEKKQEDLGLLMAGTKSETPPESKEDL